MFDLHKESLEKMRPGQQVISIVNRTGDVDRAISTALETLAQHMDAEQTLLMQIANTDCRITHSFARNAKMVIPSQPLDAADAMAFTLNLISANQSIVELSADTIAGSSWRPYREFTNAADSSNHFLTLIATQLSGATHGVIAVQSQKINNLKNGADALILELRDALGILLDNLKLSEQYRLKIEAFAELKNRLI